MENFKIRNRAELDTTEIDIFGDIGEGWFEDGVTFQGVKAQLEQVATSKIKMNVSSLGGDVNDALVIYNLLKTHPAKVEANIMGFTASSGTIIAMGADTIKMDESAMFLVHNAWTGAIGNQHELREIADNLEQIDNKLIQIYKDKTGKRKDTIGNLMKEERWLDASEAKSFGFVDESYKPMKAAASIRKDIEHINNVKQLPKIDNKMNDLNVEELKSGIVTEVINSVKDFFNKKEKEVSNEALETSVNNHVSDQLESVVNEFKTKFEELENEKNTLISDLQNKVSELENELNIQNTTSVQEETTPGSEPTPNGDKPELTVGNQILSGVFADMAPAEQKVAIKNAKK